MSESFVQYLSAIGALCFGIVVGWVTYRTLRRSQTNGLSDIATVIGAVGGAAVTAMFRRGTADFGAYCIGLMIGFFGYLVLAVRKNAPDWMGSEPTSSPAGSVGGIVIRPKHDAPDPNH